jgi:hypothetical protein
MVVYFEYLGPQSNASADEEEHANNLLVLSFLEVVDNKDARSIRAGEANTRRFSLRHETQGR